MDQRQSASPKAPRKLSILIAVFIAFFLTSSLIIQLFAYKQKLNYAKKSLSLPKLNQETADSTAKKGPEWTVIKTYNGDSLASVFQRAGLSRQTLQEILYKNKQANILSKIKPNQDIKLLIRNHALQKLILPVSTTQFLEVSRENKGYTTQLQSHKMESHNEYITATVQGSLYSTAKRENISYKLIRQLTEIFNWEIDFAKEVRAGDQISIVYEAYYIKDQLVDTGDVLAISYIHQDKIHQAIRQKTGPNHFDYFTPQGVSLKKAFIRYPIKFSHISSTYSLSRYHPILHYRRAHKGIDLAAPIGTPVHATGDGHIQIIERHSGYGNMVKVAHNKTYSSLYAHLLRFQKGLKRGDFVRRGDVIGYVGQTGLADGPHCHYEFHINHQPINPATVQLPRAAPIPAREMAAFKARANSLFAQLKLIHDAKLAATGKKKTTA